MKNCISWGIKSATFKVTPPQRLVVVCLQHVQEPHDVLVSIQLLPRTACLERRSNEHGKSTN